MKQDDQIESRERASDLSDQGEPEATLELDLAVCMPRAMLRARGFFGRLIEHKHGCFAEMY